MELRKGTRAVRVTSTEEHFPCSSYESNQKDMSDRAHSSTFSTTKDTNESTQVSMDSTYQAS